MNKDLKISYLIDLYGNLLKDRQKNFMDLYYNEDLSLSEISEIYGLTRQGVGDSIKRGENFLLDVESKLNIYEKINVFNSLLEGISNLVDCISLCNESEAKSLEISEYSTELKTLISGYLSETV